MVHQYYESEVNNEYVIRGNAAILKCSIPSFVAEFVQVVSWQDDQGNSFNPDEKNGRGILGRAISMADKAPSSLLSHELVNVVRQREIVSVTREPGSSFLARDGQSI